MTQLEPRYILISFTAFTEQDRELALELLVGGCTKREAGVELFGFCTDGRAIGSPVFGSIKTKALLALDGRRKVVCGCWSMMVSA